MDIAAAIGSEAARLTNAANDLGPTIAGMREEIERERRLPLPLVERLRELGLFSLWLARDFGGPELSLSDFVRVIETVARLDGSVGWCVMNAAAYSIFSGLLTEPVARRIFVDQRAVVAGPGLREARQCGSGGYRVTGRWAYGSGIMHSDWVIGGCVVLEGDAPRREARRRGGNKDPLLPDLLGRGHRHLASGRPTRNRQPRLSGRRSVCALLSHRVGRDGRPATRRAALHLRQKTPSSASPLPRFPLVSRARPSMGSRT